MFKQLTNRLSTLSSKLTSETYLSESIVKEALIEIRNALIEADVAVDIAKQFVDGLQSKIKDIKAEPSLTLGQALINLVRTELIEWMGSGSPINLRVKPPAVILLVGLQGVGKTTTAGKLAKHLGQDKKKIAMVSCDIYRPGAIEQLGVICQQVGCVHYPTETDTLETVRKAIRKATEEFCDVLIIDTAGRLHIDQQMMEEIRLIQENSNPVETLFVLDGMSGQDTLHSARAFANELVLSGIIMTKLDGESGGGSALSARAVIGKPIKYIGTGEKLEAFQIFHPDRIASRILGMGEMQTLFETYDKVVDKRKSKKLATKIKKGGFDFNDLRDQLEQINKMGGINSLMDKLPAAMTAKIPEAKANNSEKQIQKMLAVIDSMTIDEKIYPNLLNGSRKRRIASGSGTHIQDINRVLKQYQQMKKLLGKGRKLKGMADLAKGKLPSFQ